MHTIGRRNALRLTLAASCLPIIPKLLRAQTKTLALMTAGRGSGFLPYGRGLAKIINASGIARIDVMESKGSNENLAVVETSPNTLGLAFLGAAHAAMTGTGFAAGKNYEKRSCALSHVRDCKHDSRAEIEWCYKRKGS